MTYNDELANRVRESFAHIRQIEEKLIFWGLCFMVNGTMCIYMRNDKMMCRIDPDAYHEALKHEGLGP